MYFEFKFCTIVVYEVVYNQVFLFNFFETLKFDFFCGSKRGSTEPVHQNDALISSSLLRGKENQKLVSTHSDGKSFFTA
jgi:hypothetical protein